MKVRVRKHCKINGKPAHPGTIHEVTEQRAKALTDNGYAEHVFSPPAKAPAGSTTTNPPAGAPSAAPSSPSSTDATDATGADAGANASEEPEAEN